MIDIFYIFIRIFFTTFKKNNYENFHKSELIYSPKVDGKFVNIFDAESTMTCDLINGFLLYIFTRSLRHCDLLSICPAEIMFLDVLIPFNTPIT